MSQEGETNQSGAPVGGGTAVNMDALSAPAGGYDPFIHNSESSSTSDTDAGNGGDMPGGNGIPEGLPNLDEEGQFGNHNAEPEATRTDPDDYTQTIDSVNPDENQDPNAGDPNSGGDSYWMRPFDKLKEQYPDWEIPEGINEENYLDVYRQVTQPQQQQIHPDLLKMQEALNSGVELNELVQRMNDSNVSSMTDRDLLAANYKENFKNWDDGKISQVLDKLDSNGMLEIEATKLRNAMSQQDNRVVEQMTAQRQSEYQEQLKQMDAERAVQINESLDIINKAEDIYGLPISQAEKSEFSQFFSELVTPDAKTGVAPMMDMLQSNETLVKVAMMMWKGDEKVRGALTNAKESGKNAMLGKLDKKPQTTPRGGNAGDPTKVDLDALSAPERIGR